MTIGYSEIYEGNIPLWVAQDAGIFKQNGISAKLIYTASNTATAALLSNQVQITNGGGSEALSANANGSDLVLVGTIIPKQPYVFMSTSDIKTVADLKGKKVGASSAGSASDVATRVGLEKQGLTPDKDVQIVYVGSSANRTAALKSGSIQGGLEQPPDTVILEREGLHVLFDEAKLNLPTVNNGMIVTRSYLNSNRPVVQRYVNSIVEAISWAKANKAKTLQIMSKYLKVTDQQALQTSYDFTFNEIVAPIPTPSASQFTDIVTQLAAKNPKVKSVDVNKMIDASLVQNAANQHLDKAY